MKPISKLSIWTDGISNAERLHRDSVYVTPPYTPIQSSGDIFSPLHWAEDNFTLVPDEVAETFKEFKTTTVLSNDFSLDTFSNLRPSSGKISKYIKSTALYNKKLMRWNDIPWVGSDAKPLLSPIHNLIDDVLVHFKYTHCAVLSSVNIPAYSEEHQMRLIPDFMGLGCEGPNFGPAPNPLESGPSYMTCLSFVEVRTEASKDLARDMLQMALYARQCFRVQENRKCVYGLLLTEDNFQLFMFDRSGLCYSRPYNMHRYPALFVRMLLGIWSPDNDLIGFDTTIFWKIDDSGLWNRYIRSLDENSQPMEYKLTEPCSVFSRWYICGRGTCCWESVDDNGRKVLIKDSWRDNVDNMQAQEAEFLKAATGMDEVVQVISTEFGQLISEIRGASTVSSIQAGMEGHFKDRRFSRIVLHDYGDFTIENFRGRRELLFCLRDVIIGHQKLWNAGILHADINTDNILLAAIEGHPEDGRRGVLIDLDCAIWLKPSHWDGYHAGGTRAYASVNVLEFNTPGRRQFSRDYLDDLESLFYLLCKICCSFSGPGERVEKMPDFWAQWNQEDPLLAATAKTTSLLSPDYQPTPYFGDIFETLLESMREFFAEAAGHKRTTRLKRERAGTPCPTWEDLMPQSEKDYKTVVDLIDQAIEDLTFGRFVAVHDPQLEEAYAKLIEERAAAAPNPEVTTPSREEVQAPVYLSASPSLRRKACDDDDIGHEIPPPKKARLL